MEWRSPQPIALSRPHKRCVSTCDLVWFVLLLVRYIQAFHIGITQAVPPLRAVEKVAAAMFASTDTDGDGAVR